MINFQKGDKNKDMKLTIIWNDGNKEVQEYDSIEYAEKAERNLMMAFGSQISWTGISDK